MRERTDVPVCPPGWYGGADASGAVRVRLDAGGGDVAVELERGWRTRVGADGLGRAVVQAFAAACAARLAAWATGPARRPVDGVAPDAAPGPTSAAAAGERVRAVLRARRDLPEYARRLAELHRAPAAVTSPCGRVRVTVAAGQVVAVEPDAAWIVTAGDPAPALTGGLRAALRTVAAVPERALDGCPDLVDLLRGDDPAAAVRAVR